MKTESFATIPMSRFRRELRKWIRICTQQRVYVTITRRNKEPVIFVPEDLLEELYEKTNG